MVRRRRVAGTGSQQRVGRAHHRIDALSRSLRSTSVPPVACTIRDTIDKSRWELSVMRRLPWRLMAAATGLLLALTLSAPAQRQKSPERASSVTILTDGIAEPNSRATRAINELARELGNVRGNVRGLPMAGLGAGINVRDLIQLRGVDLAVLNSDIFLFLDQTRQSPAARDHIRYVTHMYSQKVYLLARKEFNTLKDLRGRKLAVLASGTGSHTTATTLFGVL